AITGAAGTDVTGGMLLRLETAERLARRGITSWIADGRRPGLFRAALDGKAVPGTAVPARPGAPAREGPTQPGA
ncbi:MAG: hypothetical protein MI919_03535, partial [Holophagales bacterium]|nr:hypothetical protein [Holophagales bacterium]